MKFSIDHFNINVLDLEKSLAFYDNRMTSGGEKLGPEQCIPVYEALKMVTINAAHQYFEEDKKGTLESGKIADLVILSGNPLKVDPMAIKDIAVEETIKEGITVYRKK